MMTESLVKNEEPIKIIEEFPVKIEKQFSSRTVSSVNLLKNMLGAGVFSLNSKVSSISTNPLTALPAALLVFAMATWATYNFYSIGKY